MLRHPRVANRREPLSFRVEERNRATPDFAIARGARGPSVRLRSLLRAFTVLHRHLDSVKRHRHRSGRGRDLFFFAQFLLEDGPCELPYLRELLRQTVETARRRPRSAELPKELRGLFRSRARNCACHDSCQERRPAALDEPRLDFEGSDRFSAALRPVNRALDRHVARQRVVDLLVSADAQEKLLGNLESFLVDIELPEALAHDLRFESTHSVPKLTLECFETLVGGPL